MKIGNAGENCEKTLQSLSVRAKYTWNLENGPTDCKSFTNGLFGIVYCNNIKPPLKLSIAFILDPNCYYDCKHIWSPS